MLTREVLAQRIAQGESFDFLFFWGHTPKAEGAVDKSCFSQWFPRAFVVEGVEYRSAEHWMMAEKARVCGDRATLEKILEAATPADAKALGREVTPYDGKKWDAARFESVVRGNVEKFGQHADLKAFLLGTGEQVLVEASPRDAVWGIGMGASNVNARDPSRWRGTNLLGFALMEARAVLKAAG